MALEYRFATEEDLQQIFEIEQSVMPCPWSMKSFQEAFSSDYSFILVAVDDYRICGFSVLYISYCILWHPSCRQVCKKLKKLDVSKFKTGKVTDMDYIFYCCESLESLDVWKVF